MLSFSKKYKDNGSSQSKNVSSKPDFRFREPFLLFVVKGNLSIKQLKKIIASKTQYYLNTKDYFYGYRKLGDNWLVLSIKATDWDNDNVFHGLQDSHPLLLHLKPGKYAVRGKNCIYNVNLTDDTVSVLVGKRAEDGYRAPNNNDYLSPSVKLAWSLQRPEYHTVITIMSMMALLSFVLLMANAFFWYKGSSNLASLKAHVARKTVVKMPAIPSENLEYLIDTVNRVGARIRGLAFIKKAFSKNGQIHMDLKCIEGNCILPFQGVTKKRNGVFEYVVKGGV